jgi:hypothetical protein
MKASECLLRHGGSRLIAEVLPSSMRVQSHLEADVDVTG